MADPFRNLKLYWHRARETPVVTLEGIRLNSGPDLARAVRNGLYKRTYEAAERALLKTALRPGETVLEIGGGIGFIGLLAAKLADPGRVVSYEANPAMQPVIAANYALNARAPELRMRAISCDGADVTFHTSDNVISSSLYQRDETQKAVTVASDALSAALAEVKPDFLVMDVEGAEVDLLAEGDLAPARALLVELHPHIVGEERIAALLASLDARGFEVVAKQDENVLLRRRDAASATA